MPPFLGDRLYCLGHSVKRRLQLHLGDISVQRDWGWAPEYVEATYLMLQQEQADDYVIATGESHKLEDFVAAAFACVGLDWQEYVVIDASLLRPTDIAVGQGISGILATRLSRAVIA